jgi:hypothetical protein
MEDNFLKKMEDDLNFKAFLFSLFNNKNLKNKWFWPHRDWPSYKEFLLDGVLHIKNWPLSICIALSSLCNPVLNVHNCSVSDIFAQLLFIFIKLIWSTDLSQMP